MNTFTATTEYVIYNNNDPVQISSDKNKTIAVAAVLADTYPNANISVVEKHTLIELIPIVTFK